jgi:hypothetical protein
MGKYEKGFSEIKDETYLDPIDTSVSAVLLSF